VSDLRIEHSCGVSIVDDAALKAVRNAQPFRPPPAGAKDPVTCEFTFDYKATHGSLR
jgi:TonB family protein